MFFVCCFLDQESSSKPWMRPALESKLLVRPRSKQIVIPARVCREMGEGSKNSSFHTQNLKKTLTNATYVGDEVMHYICNCDFKILQTFTNTFENVSSHKNQVTSE